jgi:hypothetical protein
VFRLQGSPRTRRTSYRRLGGVTRVVVLDNLREGVLKPDVYDSTVNPLYRDVLSHYGSVALACRVRGSGSHRVRRRPCQENAPEGTALRKSGGSPDLPGPLGEALGGHAHSRHHQTPSGSHVRRREARVATAADRAFPLLPIWSAHGKSGWLKRT